MSKVADCDNCILWEEIDSLNDEVANLNSELLKVNTELDGYKSAEEKSKKRLLEQDMEADRLLKTAMYKYHVKLKALKLFADKFGAVFKDDTESEKRAIIDLLTDFLKDVDSDGYLYKAEEKAEELKQKVFNEKQVSEEEAQFYGDTDFDLDEAVNPSEELDLKTLLEELGVFGGN